MSIQRAEELKQEWTDKQVVIRSGIPELRRFDGLVGHVRTVNMNCRLLIEFDTPADISWYDIDPEFVTIVKSAQVKPSPEESVDGTNRSPTSASTAAVEDAAQPNVSVAAATTKTPTVSSAGTSPLGQIRKQAAAAGSAGSPLDQIRKGGAIKTSRETSITDGEPENDSTTPDSGDPGTVVSSPNGGGSPLDSIRRQAAAKASTTQTSVSDGDAVVQTADVSASSSITDKASATLPVTVDVAEKLAAAATPAAPAPVASSAASTTVNTNPLDQIRAQAAADSDTFGVGESNATSTIFDQVRAQATED